MPMIYRTEQRVIDLINLVEKNNRELDRMIEQLKEWDTYLFNLNDPIHGRAVERRYIVMGIIENANSAREEYEKLKTEIRYMHCLSRDLSQWLWMRVDRLHAKYKFIDEKLGPALASGDLSGFNRQLRNALGNPFPKKP